jgi:hypothetical protein
MKKLLTMLFIFGILLNSAAQAAGERIPMTTAPSIDAPVFGLVALFRADLTVMKTVITGDIPLAPAFGNPKQCRDTVNDLSLVSGYLSPDLRKTLMHADRTENGSVDTGVSTAPIAARRTTSPPPGGDISIHRSLLAYLVRLSLSNLPGEITMSLSESPAAQMRVRAFSFNYRDAL